MSLYPSLEDLKEDNVTQAQTAFSANPANPAILSEAAAPISQDGNLYPKLYPELKSIDNDIFVQLVQANSPASLVGLRFGDQVLQISGENCFWREDYHDMTIRDRPFERTITTHKDSTGHVGFIFKNGKIVKNSSAARNGLLMEHNIYEINRQNVIGLKNSQIADILSTYGTVVTITIIREHIIKRMAPSIMKSLMDHTIPEV
uniref:PDZ domain-containing protein n=1 Tax=Gorilla gorilla gorilla TaxID=9595 RepID=A0A2I2Z727_GORGO